MVGRMSIKEDTRELPPETLPANVHAERTILGAILLDNAAHAEAAATLESDDFSLDSHRRIFLRMTELVDSKHAIDIVTLADRLDFFKETSTIGGVAYLASLTEGLPRRPVIREYIRIVKEKRQLRRIIAACEEATKKAQEQSTLAADIVAEMGLSLKGIAPRRGKP